MVVLASSWTPLPADDALATNRVSGLSRLRQSRSDGVRGWEGTASTAPRRPFMAVGMHRALESAVGLPTTSTSALRMLVVVTGADHA